MERNKYDLHRKVLTNKYADILQSFEEAWYLSFLLPAFSAEPSGSCALPVSCGPPLSSSCLMRSEGRAFRLSS